MSIVLEQPENRVELVLCGCGRDDLRRNALRICRRRFGAGEWRACEETFRPSLVSLGGRVRLWEGRFAMERLVTQEHQQVV